MGYKQHNNPFSRKISSPLKHNVTNAAGETWRHGHRKNGKTVSLESRNIAGSSDFGKRANRAVRDQETRTKRLSDERGGGRATEKNYAMDYANQIADMYNRGELVDGQFIADDFDKRKSKLSIKNNRLKIKPRFKSVGDAQRYNVQYADMQEGFDPEVGFQAAETQVTPEQIYEMMVQGGGMVSIVDGQIVAGNPNEVKYELSDEDYNKASLSGTNRYNTSIFDSNYVPEGFTSDERSDQPKKKLTVADALLERRIQKNNPINRVMSSSPLHSNHEEMDERSNQTFNLQEGYDYDEPVINVTEGEWVNDPNNPGQQMRVITTDESITGRRKNLNPGGLGQGQAENWGKLKEEICSGKRKGNMSICDDVQSISNSVTEYRPIEVEEEEIPPPIIEEEPVVQPDRFNTSSGSLRGKGLDLPLPSVDLSQLIKTATGWFEPKSAGGGRGCGCMVNPR
jgi:hypothetical protein